MIRGTCHCASCDGRAPEWPVRPLDESDAELLADYRSSERRGRCYVCDAPTAECVCGACAYLDAITLPDGDADERRERAAEIRRACEVAGLVSLDDDPRSATWAWGLSDRLDALLRAAVARAEEE